MEEVSTTNLIINYLPQALADEEFRCMFQSIGPLKYSKIVRDKATGYSYGFGFVEYINPDDATRAITTLNGLQLQNKTMKVARARPSDQSSKGANLYIRNLPPHYREEELQDLFQSYGEIVQAKVLVDHATGQSKCVGFVLFSNRNDAETAMNALNGTTPPGGTQPYLIKFAFFKATNKITGQQQQQPKPHQQPQVQSGFHNPIPKIGGGPYGGGGGPIRNQGGRFAGGRFNPMGGAGSVGAPNQGGGGKITQGGYTLYVYNIGYDADEKTLWQLFAPLGTVQKVNAIMDHARGQCKGYGFVTMPNLEEAQYAIECMNGYFHNGRQLTVSFKT